jgi:DNA repair exonuclease SbcCD ATPase subunit
VSLAELETRVRRVRRVVDEQVGEANSVRRQRDELEEQIRSLSDRVVVHERVTSLLNSIGEEKQFAAQEAIEQLVTRGLQTIFGEDLSFHIVQDVKARRAEVSFVIRTHLENGRVVETDVMDARGGGMSAVVGFLLRLVVMLLRDDPEKDNILVLDETFAHVSEEYLPALNEFLRKIVDKTGVQIIMVTHQPEFTELADKVYRLSSKDGKTVVKEQS